MVAAVAIIPARGGSRRLPRKNIADFRGRPILSYTVAAAHETGMFGRVVVSTEDDEIAAIALACGAEVDRRGANLATDTVGVVDVCIDFLDREKAAGRPWDVMACLYATAPLRTSADIDGTMALLTAGACRFAMAVSRFPKSPYQALVLGKNGHLKPFLPEAFDSPDREQLRVDNGSTYAVETEAFRRHRTFYGPDLRAFEMPLNRSIDIDTVEDLDRAIAMARFLETADATRA